MNEVVFVMTNSQLAKKKKGRKARVLDLGDVPSDDEWIVDKDANNEDLDEHLDVEEQLGEEETYGVVQDDQVGEPSQAHGGGGDYDEGENLDDEVDGPEDEDLMEEPDDFTLSNFIA